MRADFRKKQITRFLYCFHYRKFLAPSKIGSRDAISEVIFAPVKGTFASLLDAMRLYVRKLSAGSIFQGTTRFKGELGVKLIKAKKR